MKVVHVPYTYYPDVVGGTEVFVKELARSLGECGVESVICAPGTDSRTYDFGPVKVHRIRGQGGELSVNYCYGDGDDIAAGAFRAVLHAERPTLVHIHAHSPMVSMRLAAEVKSFGVPLVFSYHTASATCQRGTLLRWGNTPCDGELTTRTCTSCIAQGLGVPRPLAHLVGGIPPRLGELLHSREGGAWTAMRMSGLIARKHAATRKFLALADAIVAPSNWVRGVLLSNGVAERKVFLCGQGVEQRVEFVPFRREARTAASPLKVIALSRLDVKKGLDVVVDAIVAAPGLNVTLDIYGLPESGPDDPYARALSAKVASDPRLRLLPPVSHENVLETIARYDVLAAPSQGYETGPLVVLEAFAARTPVLGSNLAGIADHVRDGVNGLLLPHADRNAWGDALRRLQAEPRLLQQLRDGIRRPASMAGIAARMKTLYSQLADEARSATAAA